MTIQIAEPSAASLLLLAKQAGREVGSATGFIVERDSMRYLVTNRHVVRGLRPSPLPPIPPDHLAIAHNVAGKPGTWEFRDEELYDKAGRPSWFEHPSRPADIDVAALPLRDDAGIAVYGYDPWSPGPGLALGVSEPLNIIGFPFGKTGGGERGLGIYLGIWVRGFIATEPALDWNDLPCFLIDSRTRPGQSGSPVIAYVTGAGIRTASMVMGSGPPAAEFVGVYSGRIDEKSDLGFVWKVQAVCEMLEAKKRAKL